MARLVPAHAPHGERVLALDELEQFGRALGRAARDTLPSVITLAGDLGTGKTTLTRAIGDGFGVHEPVTSPTFALVHAYEGAGGHRLFHLDLYRLKGPQDLANIGWEALAEEPALVIIEWPDRAGDLIPQDALAITLAHIDGDESRRRVSW
jgi:tRNA threonylcarbamoyladenosine biosynthesis protein TsaE